MEAIVNSSLSVLGIDEKNEILDFSMNVMTGRHGYAVLKLRMRDTGKGVNILKMSSRKIIEIKSNQTGNSGVIFKGYISDCEVNKTQSDEQVNITLISTTIDMDKKRKNKSYQKEGDRYLDIIKDTLSSVSGVCDIGDNELKSDTLKKPIIRYMETEWEFISRVASRYGIAVTPDVTADKPTVILGVVKRNSVSESDFSKKQYVKNISVGKYLYRKFNEVGSSVKLKDYYGGSLLSYGNFQIGDTVCFQGDNLIICTKKAAMDKGEVVFTYDVCKEKGNYVQPIYNRLLEGRALEGKVVKSEKETLNIQIDIDEEKKAESELFAFPWKPDTGDMLYAMPEKDSVVTLYISENDEGDAIVINTLYRKESKDRSNPPDRYFTTKENKRLFLKEKELGFSLDNNDNGKEIISIKDDAIEIKTQQDIVLQAGDSIIFSAKEVTVDGKKSVLLAKERTGIEIKKKINIEAKKVKLGIGAGVPDVPKQAKKLQLQRLTEQQTKLKNTGLASDKKTSLTGLYAVANEKFRGDQFGRSGSFNETMSAVERSEFVCSNINMTCPLGENLDGHITSNDIYRKNVSEEEQKRLSELRDKSAPITEDTIMQKVIPKETMESYISKEWKTVRNCASKAADAAPYTTNSKEVYENLRLDYKGDKIEEPDGSIRYSGGRDYENLAKTGGEVYVLRFTSKTCPDNKSLPNRTNGNSAPCTESGFIGSNNCLIPETMYEESEITDGAIFMVDKDGNEYLAAVWAGKKFSKVEV